MRVNLHNILVLRVYAIELGASDGRFGSPVALNSFIEIQDAPSDTSALVGLKEQAVTATFSVKKAYLVGSQFFYSRGTTLLAIWQRSDPYQSNAYASMVNLRGRP